MVEPEPCHVYALSGEMLPQAAATNAALLFYPRVVLHSRLLALLHREMMPEEKADPLNYLADGLMIGYPPEQLRYALVLLFQAIAQPRSRKQLFDVFEDEAEIVPILASLPFKLPPEDAAAAGADSHNALIEYVASPQERLSLDWTRLSDLLRLVGEGHGVNLDPDGSSLVHALSSAQSLQDSIAEVVGDPLDLQPEDELVGRIADQFCMYSAATILPNLGTVHCEEIVNLSDLCASSLSAYRQRARALAEDFVAMRSERWTGDFAQHATVSIASEYATLVEAVKTSSLWAVAKERSPVVSGAIMSLTSSLITGTASGNIALAVTGFGAGVTGQVLINVFEAMRRKRRLKSHHLYWRYALAETAGGSSASERT